MADEAYAQRLVLHYLNTAPNPHVDHVTLQTEILKLAKLHPNSAAGGASEDGGISKTVLTSALRALMEQRKVVVFRDSNSGMAFISLNNNNSGSSTTTTTTTATATAAATTAGRSGSSRGVSASPVATGASGNNANPVSGSVSFLSPSSPASFLSSSSNSGGGGGGANYESEGTMMVLEAIRKSGSKGIDQSQLLAQTRIPKNELAKILHYLQFSLKKIQEVRSYTNKAKRMYLLIDVMPSNNVTGGFFYNTEGLDINLVDCLRSDIVSFIANRSRGDSRAVPFTDIESFIVAQMQQSTGTAGDASDARQATVLSSPLATPVGGFPSGGGAGGAVGRSSAVLVRSRNIDTRDVLHLLRSLVYDGVILERYAPHGGGGARRDRLTVASAAPSSVLAEEKQRLGYSLGGSSVTRFFTVQPRAASGAPTPAQEGGLLALAGELLGAEASPPEKKRRRAERACDDDDDQELLLLRKNVAVYEGAVRREGQYEPAGHHSGGSEFSLMPGTGFPCLGCPQLFSCHSNGVISFRHCEYLKEWME